MLRLKSNSQLEISEIKYHKNGAMVTFDLKNSYIPDEIQVNLPTEQAKVLRVGMKSKLVFEIEE